MIRRIVFAGELRVSTTANTSFTRYCGDNGLFLHNHRAMHAVLARQKNHGVHFRVLAQALHVSGRGYVHSRTVLGNFEGKRNITSGFVDLLHEQSKATPPGQPPVVFKVHRHEPELLPPAKPTPHEFKHLSDIDDQDGFRFQMRCVLYYGSNPSMRGKDPVKVIREAFAKALVFYYPLAGRLREGPNRKLTVECTGEGILFVEADADVTLEQLGTPLHPYPGIEDLLFDVPGSSDILNCPLFLIQVTRLKCGGFVLAFRHNHTTCDGPGLVQFFSAASEIALGSDAPSVLPVWERHLLSSSQPPQVTHRHQEYEETVTKADTNSPETHEELVDRSFLFGPEELAILKRLVPQGRHTTFEILTACLWRCRTIALQLDPAEEVRVMNVVNARYNRFNPPLPRGYYGNAFALPVSATTAANLIQNPIGYALELVKKAKAQFNEEYIRSVASLMAIKGRPHFTVEGTFGVSDVKNIGFTDLDFGWGKMLYGGPADAGFAEFPGATYFMSSKTKKGEKAILVSLSLPAPAMERFAKEVQILLKTNRTTGDIGSE